MTVPLAVMVSEITCSILVSTTSISVALLLAANSARSTSATCVAAVTCCPSWTRILKGLPCSSSPFGVVIPMACLVGKIVVTVPAAGA